MQRLIMVIQKGTTQPTKKKKAALSSKKSCSFKPGSIAGKA